MHPPTTIIRRILQTEKGTRLSGSHQYLLEVALDANKPQIRQAVEQLFNVTVRKVNTMRVAGKWRRLTARGGWRPERKKAIVTLAAGQKLEVTR
jgi:large subunit ribosomal protein L23